MSPCRGDLEGAFDGFLAFDVGEVEVVVGGEMEELGEIDAMGMDGELALEEGGGFAEVADGDDLQAGDDGRFRGVVGRDQDAGLLLGAGAQGNREDAFDGADPACWEFVTMTAVSESPDSPSKAVNTKDIQAIRRPSPIL